MPRARSPLNHQLACLTSLSYSPFFSPSHSGYRNKVRGLISRFPYLFADIDELNMAAYAEVGSAPHRTAPLRTAPHRTAPHRTAPLRTAPLRTAPPRSCPSALPRARTHLLRSRLTLPFLPHNQVFLEKLEITKMSIAYDLGQTPEQKAKKALAKKEEAEAALLLAKENDKKLKKAMEKRIRQQMEKQQAEDELNLNLGKGAADDCEDAKKTRKDNKDRLQLAKKSFGEKADIEQFEKRTEKKKTPNKRFTVTMDEMQSAYFAHRKKSYLGHPDCDPYGAPSYHEHLEEQFPLWLKASGNTDYDAFVKEKLKVQAVVTEVVEAEMLEAALKVCMCVCVYVCMYKILTIPLFYFRSVSCVGRMGRTATHQAYSLLFQNLTCNKLFRQGVSIPTCASAPNVISWMRPPLRASPVSPVSP